MPVSCSWIPLSVTERDSVLNRPSGLADECDPRGSIVDDHATGTDYNSVTDSNGTEDHGVHSQLDGIADHQITGSTASTPTNAVAACQYEVSTDDGVARDHRTQAGMQYEQTWTDLCRVMDLKPRAKGAQKEADRSEERVDHDIRSAERKVCRPTQAEAQNRHRTRSEWDADPSPPTTAHLTSEISPQEPELVGRRRQIRHVEHPSLSI